MQGSESDLAHFSSAGALDINGLPATNNTLQQTRNESKDCDLPGANRVAEQKSMIRMKEILRKGQLESKRQIGFPPGEKVQEGILSN